MYLLLDVTSSNPEADLGCECALLEISQPLCHRLREVAESVIALHQTLRDLHEVRCWNWAVDYYGYSLVEACEQYDGWNQQFLEHGHAPLPAGIDIAQFAAQRTEYCQEVARYIAPVGRRKRRAETCVEFFWTTSPKHTDVHIATRSVTLPQLRRHLRGK